MNALESLVQQAMASGVVAFSAAAERGEVNPDSPISAALGDFPAQFCRIRADLVDAVRAEFAASA